MPVPSSDEDSMSDELVSPTLESHPTETSPSPPPLTPAQISRAASQTVRLAILSNEINNAFYVVNSLRHSRNRDDPCDDASKAAPQDFTLIDFGQKVSHRLAAHCLLHSLLRQGKARRAVAEVRRMMEDGMMIRPLTLEAIFEGLRDSAVAPATTPKLSHTLTKINAETVRPQSISDPSTRYAVELLLLAREYRQYRSDRMFRAVIDASLLQGHLIFASLLIAYVIKDWQAHNARTAAREPAGETVPPAEGTQIRGKARVGYPAFSPSPVPMLALLDQIQTTFDNPDLPHLDSSLRVAVQALAHLVSLVEDGSLPFSSISGLVRAAYSCPQINGMKVHICGEDGPRRVSPYSYIHRVMYDLARDLPTGAGNPQAPNETRRRLELKSYNALLHYALRHRLDFALANRITKHMTSPHGSQPPLQPDEVTYNTIMRSSTLLRRNDIAEKAIDLFAKFRQNQKVFGHRPGVTATPRISELPHSDLEFYDKLKVMLAEPFDVEDDSMKPLIVDEHTVSSYIAHLTATGTPELISALVFRLIPELHVIDHPSWDDVPIEQRKALQKMSRHRSLERAAHYGPYFFATILNALRKAGRTGLAERVWLLAKEAERASWVLGRTHKNVKPWCLSIHAYTSMMECYAGEARKGLALLRQLQACQSRVSVQRWTWRLARRARARGWAWLVMKTHNKQEGDIYRHDGARQMGATLMQGLRSGASAVYDALLAVLRSDVSNQTADKFVRGLKPPVPDARFFNPALDLFMRGHHLRPRRGRPHWGKQLRFRQRRYAERGEVGPALHPMVKELAGQMDELGLPVPIGVKAVLAGCWSSSSGEGRMTRRAVNVPFAFPPARSHKFHAWTVPVRKTKGLPVRSKHKRGQRFVSS